MQTLDYNAANARIYVQPGPTGGLSTLRARVYTNDSAVAQACPGATPYEQPALVINGSQPDSRYRYQGCTNDGWDIHDVLVDVHTRQGNHLVELKVPMADGSVKSFYVRNADNGGLLHDLIPTHPW